MHADTCTGSSCIRFSEPSSQDNPIMGRLLTGVHRKNDADQSDGCIHPGGRDTRLMLHDGDPALSDMFEQRIGCLSAAAPGRRVATGISIRS